MRKSHFTEEQMIAMLTAHRRLTCPGFLLHCLLERMAPLIRSGNPYHLKR